MNLRKLITAVLMLCPLCVSGQNKNVVIRLSGSAQVMRKGADSWVPLREKDTVKLFDIIDMTQNSSVSIMKTSTRAVYTSGHTDPISVHDIIKNAENQNMEVVRNVLKESVSSNSKQKSDFSSYGASVRGQSSNSNTDVVYACVYEAAAALASGDKVKGSKGNLELLRTTSDGLCSFKVSNKSSQTCYVNLICISASAKSMHVCYPYNMTPALSPGSEMQLPGEFLDSGDVVYMLVGAHSDFDSSLLDLKLRKNSAPETPGDFTQVFICH